MTNSAEPPGFRDLVGLLRDRRLVVLSGAGCSTESGIPDYRGPKTHRKARNPIQYRDFMADPAAQTRYWARSAIGWPRLARARPNDGHRALARMEHVRLVRGIITQNVDRLHHAAGSQCVVELHGALAEVCCLSCDAVEPRHALQQRLLELNPGWQAQAAELAPDGERDSRVLVGLRIETNRIGRRARGLSYLQLGRRHRRCDSNVSIVVHEDGINGGTVSGVK